MKNFFLRTDKNISNNAVGGLNNIETQLNAFERHFYIGKIRGTKLIDKWKAGSLET